MVMSADAVLAEVVADWRSSGPLPEIIEVIETVWRTNLDRFEPGALGDDAMSLGIQCSRNIMNLCVNRFRTRSNEIIVRGGVTLEASYHGRTMHFSKVGPQTRSWEPYSIDWDSSDVRMDGARMNAAAYTPIEGTLFDGTTGITLPGPMGNPAELRHLHLAWQGLTDTHTRVFMGFPTTGPVPWSAVMLVHDGGAHGGGVPISPNETPTMRGHDTLAEPALSLRRRTPAREVSGRDSA